MLVNWICQIRPVSLCARSRKERNKSSTGYRSRYEESLGIIHPTEQIRFVRIASIPVKIGCYLSNYKGGLTNIVSLSVMLRIFSTIGHHEMQTVHLCLSAIFTEGSNSAVV